MATNVASFTWLGWGKPGVTTSREQLRQGRAFAWHRIHQLHELDPIVAQSAFSDWLLGAQLIAHEQCDQSMKVLGEARDYSKEPRIHNPAEPWLADSPAELDTVSIAVVCFWER